MQHYEANDQKLKKFVPIIKGSLVYPVVLDAKRTVLSLPPIINGAHSAVRRGGAIGGVLHNLVEEAYSDTRGTGWLALSKASSSYAPAP